MAHVYLDADVASDDDELVCIDEPDDSDAEPDFFYTPWDEQHVGNFDIEIDMDGLDDELHDDQRGGSISDSDDDQERSPSYTVETIRERKIAKFQVQGFDYRVRVNSFDRNIPFAQAVRAVHTIIEGKMIFYISC